MKKNRCYSLEVYQKPCVEEINLSKNLSFLEQGFSGTFLPDEIDLDGMEGDEDDNF